jgi:formate/nitrite transporter FocA (FNT family)
MLSFGNLLLQIVFGGATGLNESNPGIAKFLSGAVFPFGFIMCVEELFLRNLFDTRALRIVLQGLELLTSNMMVRLKSRAFPTLHIDLSAV